MDIQMKKGSLELCVLAILSKNDCYGYELVEQVSSIVEISEGTIYPLLRRLQNEGYLDYYLKESLEGPSRKYYKLTQHGHDYLLNQKALWFKLFIPIAELLKGVEKNE